jgi:hypothetical protein
VNVRFGLRGFRFGLWHESTFAILLL